jgi:pyruvate,water dikinase
VSVVVQTQVDSDTAGVLFTRDPVTGARQRVIEASWGLGGAVAAGLVVPDRYRLNPSGALIESDPGVKRVALHLRPDEGIQEEPVAPDLVTRPCLDEDQLGELTRLAADCERLFGEAQDLEWSFAAGVLHLIQVRPMTRIP